MTQPVRLYHSCCVPRAQMVSTAAMRVVACAPDSEAGTVVTSTDHRTLLVMEHIPG